MLLVAILLTALRSVVAVVTQGVVALPCITIVLTEDTAYREAALVMIISYIARPPSQLNTSPVM